MTTLTEIDTAADAVLAVAHTNGPDRDTALRHFATLVQQFANDATATAHDRQLANLTVGRVMTAVFGGRKR